METIIKAIKDISKRLAQSFGSTSGGTGPSFPRKPEHRSTIREERFSPIDDEEQVKIWFSQKDQPWRTHSLGYFENILATLLQRTITGMKNFDWVKALPEAIENHISSYHRWIKKDNRRRRKVVVVLCLFVLLILFQIQYDVSQLVAEMKALKIANKRFLSPTSFWRACSHWGGTTCWSGPWGTRPSWIRIWIRTWNCPKKKIKKAAAQKSSDKDKVIKLKTG